MKIIPKKLKTIIINKIKDIILTTFLFILTPHFNYKINVVKSKRKNLIMKMLFS